MIILKDERLIWGIFKSVPSFQEAGATSAEPKGFLSPQCVSMCESLAGTDELADQ